MEGLYHAHGGADVVEFDEEGWIEMGPDNDYGKQNILRKMFPEEAENGMRNMGQEDL